MKRLILITADRALIESLIWLPAEVEIVRMDDFTLAAWHMSVYSGDEALLAYGPDAVDRHGEMPELLDHEPVVLYGTGQRAFVNWQIVQMMGAEGFELPLAQDWLMDELNHVGMPASRKEA